MLNSKFVSLLARLLPPRREFILRSAGHLRYFGVGRLGQISFMVLVALLVGWMGFTSARYVSNVLVAAERNVRIATSDRVIRNMQEEIDDLTHTLESTASSIDQQTAAKIDIAAKNEALRDQIATLEKERQRLGEIRDVRDRDIAELNEKLGRSENGQQDVHRKLNEVVQRHDTTEAEREQLAKQNEASNIEIARLNGKISQLNEQLELFADSKSVSIVRLGEGANQGIAALERTLVVAGLDIPLMLERVLGDQSDLLEGVGGPLVALDDESGSEAGNKLAMIEQRLLRLHGLQGLMKQLPLAAPLNEIRISSGFGRRRDPFNNRLAMHPGLDFANRSRSAIHVTAPGTVAFVGWNGGYGKTVEVDHGLGIRTRYAHMSRIFVKRGQKLEFREKVGLVGSTGRSTSSHLHYEILVDGQQLDPANFLRAGQYVFKN